MATPTYDDYMKNEKWVERIKQTFNLLDINKNGTLDENDFKRSIENIKRDVNPDQALLDKLIKAMKDLSEAMGMKPGTKLNIDEYVEMIAKMAVKENERRAKGEESLRHAVNNAWYDVVDKNHDGNVTLDEFVTIMKANSIKPEVAEARFKAIDKNNNGKIDRKELADFQYNFWFSLES